MRADGIVVFTPGVEQDLRFDHRREDKAIQAFVNVQNHRPSAVRVLTNLSLQQRRAFTSRLS